MKKKNQNIENFSTHYIIFKKSIIEITVMYYIENKLFNITIDIQFHKNISDCSSLDKETKESTNMKN